MKMKTTKFLAVLAVLAMAFAAFAIAEDNADADTTTTTYYVDGVSGSDSGDGSQDHPYKTVNKAITELTTASLTNAEIILMDDVTDVGIDIAAEKFTEGLVIDLNGKTLTLTGVVGSTGTVNQLFRILKDNVVTIENGTIAGSADGENTFDLKTMFHNYGETKLDGVVFDTSCFDESTTDRNMHRVVVNETNTLTITGKTTILDTREDTTKQLWSVIANSYFRGGYDAGKVIIDESFTGTIEGYMGLTFEIDNTHPIQEGYAFEIYAGTFKNVTFFNGSETDIERLIPMPWAYIDIKGDITLDGDSTVALQGFVYVDPEAKVSVKSGATLTVDGETNPYAGLFIAGEVVANGDMGLNSGVVTIMDGGLLTINGDLYLDDGSALIDKESLVISSKSTVEVDGAIAIDDVAATITLSKGADLTGTIINGTDDSVVLEDLIAGDNGLTISKGSIKLDGSIASGTIATEGTVEVTGEITGDLAITGGSAIIVPDGKELIISAKITGTITNEGTITLETGADLSEADVGGEGEIIDDTEEDMKDLYIGGDSEGKDTEFSAKQRVIVSSEIGYWTLNNESEITILGALVIPKGTVMTVQAGATLFINNEAKVYVYGELVIDGLDEAIGKAGTFDITTGFVSVEGDVSLNGTLIMTGESNKVTEIDVENGGSFVIGETGSFTLTNEYTEFFVAEGGELTVYGTMGATIWNSGLVTIDSEISATNNTTIYMWTAGAMVDVKNYTINATDNYTLTISDLNMIFTTFKEEGKDVYVKLKGAEDKIVIGMYMATPTSGSKSDYSITVSGIEVVSGCTSKASETKEKIDAGIYNYKQYSKYLDVSGTVFVDYTYTGTSTGSEQTVTATVDSYTSTNKDLKAQCAVKVTDAIVLNDNVVFTNEEGKLTVTGTIDAMSGKAKVTNTEGATITVDKAGEISVIGGIINTENGINAAKFVTVGMDVYGKTYKIYNYYSIDGALAAVSSGVETTEIIILGSQTLTLSEALPDGITLVLSNDKASLTIKADVAFTIADTAVVKGEGTITVDGSMYAEEKTSVKGTVKVVSDVKTEELDEKGKPTKTGWVLWTNLTAAIAAAEPGSVITITKIGLVSISKNLTLPEDITLVIPSTSEGVILSNGVTLTINGIVIVGKDSNIWAQQAFGLDAQSIKSSKADDDKSRQSSAIVVNGALVSEKAVKYGNGYAATNTAKDNSKKLALFDGTFLTTENYITKDTVAVGAGNVTAPIAGAYYTVKDGSTTYNVISSLAFAAVLADEITSANITIHGDVSGLILDFKGTDVLKSIVIGSEAGESITTPTRTDAVVTELTVATLVLNDLILNATNGAFSGIVGNGTDAITLYDAKGITVIDADDKLYIDGEMTFATTDGFAVISAGTVYLGNTGTFTTAGLLTVGDDATAIVENEVTITGILFVEGTFQVPAGKTANITKLYDLGVVDVAATTETTSQGTLNIAASGFMYIGCDGIPAAEKTEFEIAYLNGPISFGDKATVYMMDDAVVDLEASACLLALKHTTFFIEDDVFFTEFAKGDVTLEISKPKILDAVITGWADEDGKPIATGAKVGDYDEVYAIVNYNIYSVYIVTDAGVKSVAINGIEMVNQGNNVFTLGVNEETLKDFLTPLIAGTYKVTYTLKAGYQEDKNGVTLYTEDGTVLKDLKFEASGATGIETIKLQLNGTEIIPEPEPVTPEEKSEWTVTTILLCVLVVLIAIMAVIVALRLNRN